MWIELFNKHTVQSESKIVYVFDSEDVWSKLYVTRLFDEQIALIGFADDGVSFNYRLMFVGTSSSTRGYVHTNTSFLVVHLHLESGLVYFREPSPATFS